MENEALNNTKQDFTPKYYQLKRIILNEISEKKYLPDSRLPSEPELIKKYNMSRITVRHAISELISEGFVYTVQGKGSFVSTQAVEEKKSALTNKRIVFICPASNEFKYYYEVLIGIINETQSEGYKLEIYNSDWDYEKEMQLLSRCLEEPPAGLLFIPMSYENSYSHLFKLQKMGVKIALIDTRIKNYELSCVGLDHIAAVKSAVEYLIEQGHKDIAFLGWKENKSVILDIFEGYKRALEEHGLKVAPELILSNYMEETGAVKKLLSQGRKFSAVFCTDSGIMRLYHELKENGLRVPDDVSLIGFIDDYEKARNFEVPLTIIEYDYAQVGKQAARYMLGIIKTGKKGSNKPENINVKYELAVRNSVKKIN